MVEEELKRRLLNRLQWPTPMVCAPERMTRSLTSSPLLANPASSAVKLADGDGISASASAARDSTPSRRPSCTSHSSRPNWKDMASLAASATTSAQETTPGQTASSTALAVSTTSNPPSDLFGAASFSAAAALSPAAESSSTDASQPLTKQSWKKRRSSLAGSALAGSAATRASTMSRTTASAAGQLCR